MSVISLPDQLYNKKTLFTLSGSSISVWLLTIVINDAFDLHQKHKWIGLIVSLVLSFIGASQVRKLNLSLATVAFFNGLLIYVTATGIDSINNGVGSDAKTDSVKTSALIPFLRSDPWWPPEMLVEEIVSLKKANFELVSDLDSQKQALTIFRDSLIKKSNPSDSLTWKVRVADNNNKPYLDEINRLKKEIRALKDTCHSTSPDLSAYKKDIQTTLTEIKKENAKVLKALEEYLNIPLEKPLDKRKTIPQLEEGIFAWRNSLLDHNKSIESIEKKLK